MNLSDAARRGSRVLLSHARTYAPAIHGKKLADDLRAAALDDYEVVEELKQAGLVEPYFDKHQCATCYRFDTEKIRRSISEWKPEWLQAMAPKFFRKGMRPEEYAATEAERLVRDLRDIGRFVLAEAIGRAKAIVDRLLDSSPPYFPGPFVRLSNVLRQDIERAGVQFDGFADFVALQERACSLVVEICQRFKEEKPESMFLADPNGTFRTRRGTKAWRLSGAALAAEFETVAVDLEFFAAAHVVKTVEPKSNPTTALPVSDDRWLTVADAARIAGVNSGVISRAVGNQELRSNGQSRRSRRIDAADLSLWQLKRAERPEMRESDAEVARKLRSD